MSSVPSLPSLPPLPGDTSWIDNPTGMEGLPAPIAPARPNATGTSSGSSGSSSPSLWDKVKNKLGGSAGGQYTGNAFIENLVFIVLGLMLIGVGILSLGASSAFGQQVKREFVKGVKEGARTVAIE